jgi:hypothetical protein
MCYVGTWGVPDNDWILSVWTFLLEGCEGGLESFSTGPQEVVLQKAPLFALSLMDFTCLFSHCWC